MTPTETPAAPRPAKPAGWFLPYLAVAVVVVYCASLFGRMAPPREPFNLNAFAQLPVLDGGRVKPLDSAARVYLRSISGQSVFQDAAGNDHPAIEWYLDTLGSDPADKNHDAWNYRVFRVDNEQVLAQLKFQPREGLRFSLNELRPHLRLIQSKGMAAVEKKREGKKLDLEETKWLDLLERLALVRHVAQGYGHDTQDNKFHLVPPQTPGGKWGSLGELRDEADTKAFTIALETARAQLKGRAGGFGADQEAKLLDKLLRDDAATMPPERKQEIINILLTADPRLMKEEMKEVVLNTVLGELPAEQQSALKTQQAASAEAFVRANPAAAAWEDMIAARRAKDGGKFNQLLADYQAKYLDHVSGRELGKAKLETTYNRFSPFMQCTALYIIVFVMSVFGFVLKAAEKPAWGEALRKSASWVLYATLIIHTGALLVRMSLMDRPLVFVTNLYSSAVFIGWGCVMLGMVLEKLYPLGIGNAVAGILGLTTTIVAHNLATDDTLEMMQAVLDTNFWLATHVTTVTLGYTATFVAGFLGAVYVWLVLAAVVKEGFLNPQPASLSALLWFGAAAAGVVGIPLFLLWFITTALVAKFEWVHSSLPMVALVVTAGAAAFYAGGLLFLKAGEGAVDATGKPLATGQLPSAARLVSGMAMTPEMSKVLGQMIYGVVCFATLLSFVGTVLGGIWADQSWGRFWGWDPKENGAVLIVLWNALILHARWCGMVKDRGVAVLAVVGNMICAWSWFGTNQLGIGLHAYGFDTRLADGCTNFWLSQLVIIGLGLVPRAYWAGAARRAAPAPRPQSETAAAAPVVPPAPPPAVNGTGKHGPSASPSVVKGKKGKKR
ncbi:cytochrome c biogenesis protein CcsA [bacterium]|nr:cytochrome c biogenesis protein CcsA [bacterium]